MPLIIQLASRPPRTRRAHPEPDITTYHRREWILRYDNTGASALRPELAGRPSAPGMAALASKKPLRHGAQRTLAALNRCSPRRTVCSWPSNYAVICATPRDPRQLAATICSALLVASRCRHALANRHAVRRSSSSRARRVATVLIKQCRHACHTHSHRSRH